MPLSGTSWCVRLLLSDLSSVVEILVFLTCLPTYAFFTEFTEFDVVRQCWLHWIRLDLGDCIIQIRAEEVLLRLVRIWFSLSLRFNTGLDLVRRGRNLVDSYADSVVDGVDYCHVVDHVGLRRQCGCSGSQDSQECR